MLRPPRAVVWGGFHGVLVVVVRGCLHCAQTVGPVGEERHPQVSVYEETVLLTRTVNSLVRVSRRAVDTGHDDQSQTSEASDHHTSRGETESAGHGGQHEEDTPHRHRTQAATTDEQQLPHHSTQDASWVTLERQTASSGPGNTD